MIYREFADLKLSALGMGAMRLPVIDGKEADIDAEQTKKMVAYAMEKGINYYDTAWGYHDGNSETVMGEALSAYPRESFYLADKFPGYDLANMDKVESIFEEQLKKCRVDYFDFYLFHNVCEKNIDEYLNEEHGIMDYLWKQKENGRIKHLGFSVHGSTEVTKRFLEKYGDRMEFCQIQLNYLDMKFQNADEKLELLKQYDIPVWVMEPIRGGRLAKLTDGQLAKLKAARPDESAVGWAFRYIQTIPGVVVTLSGMSDFDQMKENIEIFQREEPLTDGEMKILQEIGDEMLREKTVPCTACRYCTSHCPQKLDIPELLRLYNEHAFTGGGFIAPMLLGTMPDDKKPSACIGCRSCEAVCPQQIKISEVLADFAEKLKE